MKNMLARAAAIAMLLVCFTAPASADSAGIQAPRVSNMTVTEFLAFHHKLAAKLDSRPYEHVDNEQRREVADAQGDIKRLLEGKSSMDELTEAERASLFNAHERVVAVMNDAELDRMICKREQKIGSHRGELVCRTQRQIRDEREAYRRNNQRTRTCLPGVGC
jgi:hypothetical protein